MIRVTYICDALNTNHDVVRMRDLSLVLDLLLDPQYTFRNAKPCEQNAQYLQKKARVSYISPTAEAESEQ